MAYGLLKLAIGLFVVAACFGLAVLIKILKDKSTIKIAVICHGIIAATGLGLVFYYVINNPQHSPITSLVLLTVAALGGFTLLSFDLRHKKISKILVLAHPLIAICGLVSLIFFVMTV